MERRSDRDRDRRTMPWLVFCEKEVGGVRKSVESWLRKTNSRTTRREEAGADGSLKSRDALARLASDFPRIYLAPTGDIEYCNLKKKSSESLISTQINKQ